MTKTQKRGKTMDTSKSYLSKVVKEMPDSGIKDFFDIANTMEGALSLGVGEPDFDTPWHIRDEGIYSLEKGKTHYTSNAGLKELKTEIDRYLNRHYGISYDVDHEIMVTIGGSEAIDAAMRAMLDPGDEVLIPQPSYVSYVPCAVLAGGVPVVIELKAENEFRLTAEELEAAITPKTKAIVCTNGSNLTGNYVDVAAVGEMAHRHGVLLIVDASQTAGVFPIDVQKMNIDVLCFTGHKGLLAPQGTGGLYVREGLTVRPLLSGGSGVQTYNKKHPVEMPTALEAGTLNGHGIAGMNAALAYLEETGIDTIREREQELMWKFYEGVKDIPNVTVYGDFSTKNRCAIVALNIGDYDSAEVSDELLTEYGISTRPGGHCAPLAHEALGNVEQGAVRFSFSHYNTDEEIETAIRAIEELAQDEE